MIKSIRIKNLESHKDTYLEFSSGFNVLCGDSDAGKTSVVRALQLVCYNVWDKKMLRLGCKNAEVFLVTDKGEIKVIRGDENTWKIKTYHNNQTYDFTKVGKEAPEIVSQVTGMPKMKIGDITDYPNFILQLDKHYMLAEIDGKKCSSNMTARMIDRIIGLGGMEELIINISTDGSKKKRKYNENTSRISTIKNKLHDEFLIKDSECKLQTIKKILKSVKDKKTICMSLEKTYVEYTKNIARQKQIEHRLYAYKDVDKLIKQQQVLKKQCAKHYDMNCLHDNYLLLINKLLKINGKLSKKTNTDTLQKKHEHLKQLLDQFHKTSEIHFRYDNAKKQLEKIQEQYKQTQINMKEIELERIAFLKEHPYCPLCKNKIGDKIEHEHKCE